MAKQPSRKPSKIRAVPIAQMRIPPALVTQREFRKAHGDRIAAELDLNKIGYPIINHRDGNYWVCDGQHRIYALRQNGFENDALDCEVFDGPDRRRDGGNLSRPRRTQADSAL
jgi:ParB-like chromosome segregation protein Spo0J